MKMHSILAFLLLLNPAFATSFFIRPFSEFTQMTPNIVRGTIRNIYVDHSSTETGEKEIYTFAELDIKEVLKGSIENRQITIRKLGGTKDGITLEIPSSVEFKTGEESVFFLNPQLADRSFEVSGMELGRFDLVMEKGKEVLKGGIFLYSKPHSKEESHFLADNIKENQKTWSFDQLRALVQHQSSVAPPSSPTPEIRNSQLNTNGYNNSGASTPPPQGVAQPPQESLIVTQEDKTPLYFEPTVWYILAILVLTLGAIKVMRRG